MQPLSFFLPVFRRTERPIQTASLAKIGRRYRSKNQLDRSPHPSPTAFPHSLFKRLKRFRLSSGVNTASSAHRRNHRYTTRSPKKETRQKKGIPPPQPLAGTTSHSCHLPPDIAGTGPDTCRVPKRHRNEPMRRRQTPLHVQESSLPPPPEATCPPPLGRCHSKASRNGSEP